MLNRRVIFIASSILILVAVMLGLLLIDLPSGKTSSNETEQSTSSAIDMGITYVPITSRISAYNSLGVTSGALVTEVVPGSSADRAGVEVGDVIISFNDSKVEEETPLLGMMMTCSPDDNISMEVQTGMNTRMVEILRHQK